MTARVAWARLESPIGVLHLYRTERGVVHVALANEPRSVAEAHIKRVVSPASFAEDEATLADALAQLTAYFAQRLTAFDVALDLRGTPFQRTVWEAVGVVPYGQTETYRNVAQSIGRPTAVRAVGAANGANPVPLLIPCHRIVGTNGSLTGYGGGLDIKRRLLAMERGSGGD